MLRRISAVSLCAVSFAATGQPRPILTTADLTDTPRKLYHADVELPVKAGDATFTTPEWIPGNHSPTAVVCDIVGVTFTANGKVLPWCRDDLGLYWYHVTIPAGVTTLRASGFDRDLLPHHEQYGCT